ncbi:unnamed protein product [Rotaria sp. Silwood2]|nr:unnamed protein product [Rotaria sp. Silwood2]
MTSLVCLSEQRFRDNLTTPQPPEPLFGEDKNGSTSAETLITPIINILIEQTSPSPELVEKVRDLYNKRLCDVRFLIPILTGLEKRKILSALPKLIKLSPPVVKQVFNRLLPKHYLLNERTIYTDDVFTLVIQQLVHINPIPVLFMRTVLQALSFYPKMVRFVMDILQRLIRK